MPRKSFLHQGKVVYQYQQALEQVNVFVKPPPQLLPKNKERLLKQLPPGTKVPKLTVTIKSHRLTVGIQGNPPYLDFQLAGTCDSGESCWTIQDDELHITLTKANKGVLWPGVFKGQQQVNPMQIQQTKKKLLLERFQEENPGFDFSGAQFNGMVPDARTFMGGIH